MVVIFCTIIRTEEPLMKEKLLTLIEEKNYLEIKREIKNNGCQALA